MRAWRSAPSSGSKQERFDGQRILAHEGPGPVADISNRISTARPCSSAVRVIPDPARRDHLSVRAKCSASVRFASTRSHAPLHNITGDGNKAAPGDRPAVPTSPRAYACEFSPDETRALATSPTEGNRVSKPNCAPKFLPDVRIAGLAYHRSENSRQPRRRGAPSPSRKNCVSKLPPASAVR